MLTVTKQYEKTTEVMGSKFIAIVMPLNDDADFKDIESKYVVVLEPQMRNNANAYYLLTAYYLNEKYGEKQLKKKLKSKIDSVL